MEILVQTLKNTCLSSADTSLVRAHNITPAVVGAVAGLDTLIYHLKLPCINTILFLFADVPVDSSLK